MVKLVGPYAITPPRRCGPATGAAMTNRFSADLAYGEFMAITGACVYAQMIKIAAFIANGER